MGFKFRAHLSMTRLFVSSFRVLDQRRGSLVWRDFVYTWSGMVRGLDLLDSKVWDGYNLSVESEHHLFRRPVSVYV